MKAVVVYESLWGNTAAIARAIAEGIGPETRALSTGEASGTALAGVDLIVAGAPVIQFRLPSEKVREDLGKNPGKAPTPPNLSHPSMRSWLDELPEDHGRSAAFETRVRFSPGGSTSAIAQALEGKGYSPVAEAQRFFVKGTYGPMRDGELERARLWGEDLAHSMDGLKR
jgi:hypothetical protein